MATAAQAVEGAQRYRTADVGPNVPGNAPNRSGAAGLGGCPGGRLMGWAVVWGARDTGGQRDRVEPDSHDSYSLSICDWLDQPISRYNVVLS